MSKCPNGYAWDEKLQVCIQETSNKWRRSSSSHFMRNIGLFALGFLFGYFALWNYTSISFYGFGILTIGFLVLLAVTFFMDSRPAIYPVVGFIVGLIASYWSQISGFISMIGL